MASKWRYIVVRGNTPQDVVNQVNDRCEKGWVPIGGLAIETTPKRHRSMGENVPDFYYYQAMKHGV